MGGAEPARLLEGQLRRRSTPLVVGRMAERLGELGEHGAVRRPAGSRRRRPDRGCRARRHRCRSGAVDRRPAPRDLVRVTSMIARVMLMPRGQASTQLKVVRQRQTPSASAMIWSRSSCGVIAAVDDEPMGVHDRGRADVVLVRTRTPGSGRAGAAQDARLVSSNRSRSSGDWRRSLPSAGTSSLTRNGITERY